MPPAPIPEVTSGMYEGEYKTRHLLHAALDHWADQSPGGVAILNATRGTPITWQTLSHASAQLALELDRMGFRKGDFFAASLPLLTEHVILEYACFRLGVIHVPLDLRLQPAEVIRSVGLVRPKAFAFLGQAMGTDFGQLGLLVGRQCSEVEHLIQFAEPGECAAGTLPFSTLMARASNNVWRELPRVDESDGAQVIFTTGSTGSPKPALLSHRGITAQNLCLGTAFGFGPGQRVLCNLPPSHVGGQAELLLTSLYMGGTAVTLEVFDAVKSLDAIEQHRVTLLGQIPALFQMEWRTAGYEKRDLSSLRVAVYGGQPVPRPFLDRMLTMAPAIGTGLGLTETSGFCTYTPLTSDAAEVAQGIGYAMPLYPLSIRQPMRGNKAGEEVVSSSEIGHICFQGPQNFLGYVGDPSSSAEVLSTDGVLYSGDMGYADERGLHFCGRAKWVLKPAGYQVFPGDVEDHFSQMTEKVASVGVVGCEHQRWSEGIIAFIEKRPGAELNEVDLRKHARLLTSYMRPLHYVILEAGTMPLNRTAKVDVGKLKKLAEEEVCRLRQRGRWDGAEGERDQ